MSVEDLAPAVKAMRPFLPAKDFEVSRSFYRDIGFSEERLDHKLVEMRLGSCSFLLQDFYVQQWAENMMMHFFVGDVGGWWSPTTPPYLPARYGVNPPRAPKDEPWGLR